MTKAVSDMDICFIIEFYYCLITGTFHKIFPSIAYLAHATFKANRC